MQDTRVYDYMIRSGTITCKWESGKEELPLLIGPEKPQKKNHIIAWCKLKTSYDGLRVEVFVDNDLGLPLSITSLSINTTVSIPQETKVFCNGFQSWSHSSMRSINTPLKYPFLLSSKTLKNSGDYSFTKYKTSSVHSWGYTYFNSPLGFTFMGSLDESIAFTKFKFYRSKSKENVNLEITKDCDGLVLPVVPRTSKEVVPPVKIADIFIISGDESKCLDNYFSLFYSVNKSSGIKNRTVPSFSWDSWYSLYDYVTENRLLEVLKDYKVNQIPLDYFIIGRGYEKVFGDWTDPDLDKFPGGLQRVVKTIKSAGYKPGITVSPFICSQKSMLYKERPELLARNSKGRLIVVGNDKNLGGKLYLIDLYNPEGERYIKRLIKNLCEDLGFEVIKLDFLYAASLQGGIGFKHTRAQVMSKSLQILRTYAKDVPLIACAVPLNSAFGLFEHVSITPELSPSWGRLSPSFCSRNVRERESTYNAIQTAITRRHLSGKAFGSDCGTFTLRKYKTKLSTMQQDSLFNCVTVLGNLISSSDSIGSYSKDLLSKYRRAVELRGRRKYDKKILGIEIKKEGTLVKYLLGNEENETLISEVTPDV